MSRPFLRLTSLVAAALVGLPGAAAAQPPEWDDDSPVIAARERAKAAFEASQADPRQLARDRLDAARSALQTRLQEYAAGRASTLGGMTSFLGLADAVVRSGLALAASKEERLVLLEWFRAVAQAADDITAARYAVGRIGPADHAQARALRLGADLRLLAAAPNQGQPIPPWAAPGAFQPLSDWVAWEADPGGPRRYAGGQFAALTADRRDLARARLEAARTELQERARQFQAGRATLNVLLESLGRFFDASASAGDKESSRLAAAERRWLIARQAEQTVTAGYQLGRMGFAGLMEAKYVRLSAEIELSQARVRAKASDPLPETAEFLTALGRFGPPLADPEEGAGSSGAPLLRAREAARALFEAGRSPLRDLLAERLAAARAELRQRLQEYEAGRGTFDILRDAARRRLEAECAVFADPAGRVAAHERYWEVARTWEDITAARYRAARVGLTDLMEARYDRLDAEIRLAESRARAREK
jgi:hypothetical protein